MQRIQLTFRQRLLLSDVVGGQRGSVSDMLLCGRIFEKIRFSPDEARQSGLTLNAEKGLYNWDPAADGKFQKTVDFEDEEARRLKTVIDSHTAWTLPDARAIDLVRQQLSGGAPVNPALAPEGERKNGRNRKSGN